MKSCQVGQVCVTKLKFKGYWKISQTTVYRKDMMAHNAVVRAGFKALVKIPNKQYTIRSHT